MKLLLTYLLILSPLYFVQAQKLSAHVSEEFILIGEETTITYKISTKAGDSITFDPFQMEIPSKAISGGKLTQDGALFEIIDEFDDTVIINGSKMQWTGKYVVTAWDSGMFVIPGPQVIIDDSLFYFDNLMISCDLVEHDSKVDLYDIREHFAEVPDQPFDLFRFLGNNWWWILLVIIAAVVFIMIRKRNRETDEEPVQHISLKQRTLLAIEALDKEKLWEKDKLKEHFVELSYILRSYLTARYDISLLEKTTHQAKLILKEKGLEDDTIDVINRILSQSDMVKFARSKPDSIDILKISALAKQIVAETSPLEIEDAE